MGWLMLTLSIGIYLYNIILFIYVIDNTYGRLRSHSLGEKHGNHSCD